MTILTDWWNVDRRVGPVSPDPPPPPPPYSGEYTTEEWWDIDGVGLNHYAYNIATLEGRESLPPMRGSNIQIGNRPGKRWVPKVPDERAISLAMWVRGSTKDGGVSVSERPYFWQNWEELKRLFGQPDRQMVATRRMRFPDRLETRTALVEIAGDMALKPQGRGAGSFVVDLLMADPFWYGPVQTLTIDRTTLHTGGFGFPLVFPLIFDIPVDIDYGEVFAELEYQGVYESTPHVRIDGPLLNPSIYHVESGSRLTVVYDLQQGEHLDFDFENSRVILNDTTSKTNALATGSRWFKLQRDTNTIGFGGVTGEGLMTLSYRPNYW